MQIEIPGRGGMDLQHAVFDFNGTLAVDGELIPGVERWLPALQQVLDCVILTADTFGTVEAVAGRLGCRFQRVRNGEEKARIVQALEGGVVAVGNGQNDAPMFSAATLSIGVLGPEGTARAALAADVIAASIEVAFGMLLHPERLVATLRT